MTNNLISIIIPTFNRKEVLGRAIDSVLAQTYANWELIIVDSGSTDGTSDLVTKYSRGRLVIPDENRGAAAARNIGVKDANGSYIAFLDSDDEWHPTYLSEMVDILDSYPDTPLVYSGYVGYIEDKEVKRTVIQPKENQIPDMLNQSFIHTMSTVVVRKSVFDTVGMFTESLDAYHDVEFYLRVIHLVGDAKLLPKLLVNKYWQTDSMLTSPNWKERAEYGVAGVELFYKLPNTEQYKTIKPRAIKMRYIVAQNIYNIFSRRMSG